MLIFAASDFTFITRHIHNWVLLPLWTSCFFFSGAINNSPLSPSSILDTFQPGGLSFQCRIFLSFYTVYEVPMASILGWFSFHPPVDHVLSELSVMTCPSWVDLPSMALWVLQALLPCQGSDPQRGFFSLVLLKYMSLLRISHTT